MPKDPAPKKRKDRSGESPSGNDPAWKQAQEDRIALIETQGEKKDRQRARAFEAGRATPGQNFDPGAPSRFRTLRALARFLLLASYLLLGLAFAGIGVTVWLWRDGVIESEATLALALVGWLMVGGFSYCLFKFLGELSWLLADFGDHQVDTRNLLIDLRDSIERK